jgi:hypothetical protein
MSVNVQACYGILRVAVNTGIMKSYLKSSVSASSHDFVRCLPLLD